MFTQVDVYAIDTLTGALTTLIGTQTVDTNTPLPGAQIESVSATSLVGWAFDADAGAASIQVQYQIDDSLPVTVLAKVSRPDLTGELGSKNHGYSIAMPAARGWGPYGDGVGDRSQEQSTGADRTTGVYGE